MSAGLLVFALQSYGQSKGVRGYQCEEIAATVPDWSKWIQAGINGAESGILKSLCSLVNVLSETKPCHIYVPDSRFMLLHSSKASIVRSLSCHHIGMLHLWATLSVIHFWAMRTNCSSLRGLSLALSVPDSFLAWTPDIDIFHKQFSV